MPATRPYYPELWIAAMAALLTAATAAILLHLTANAPIQRQNASLIELIFGDARQQLSAMLYDKVEEYYHGGVRHEDCDHTHDHDHDDDADADHDHADDHDHPHHLHNDLWSRLNRQLHIQEHRHLKATEMVEVLPWLWAACRTSPNNVQAYTSGAFILTSKLNRSDQALLLLQQGIEHNPKSAELELALGQLYFTHLKDKANCEIHMHATLDKLPPLTPKTSDDQRRLRLEALFYLAHLAHQRNDLPQLRHYTQQAELTLPNHISTQTMRQWLTQGQTPHEGQTP